MCILDHAQSTFFFIEEIPEEMENFNEQTICSYITKGSIYYIECMYIQHFSLEVD